VPLASPTACASWRVVICITHTTCDFSSSQIGGQAMFCSLGRPPPSRPPEPSLPAGCQRRFCGLHGDSQGRSVPLHRLKSSKTGCPGTVSAKAFAHTAPPRSVRPLPLQASRWPVTPASQPPADGPRLTRRARDWPHATGDGLPATPKRRAADFRLKNRKEKTLHKPGNSP
jgi:hypothetical protein